MWLLVGGDSEIGAATYKALKAQGRPVAATTRRVDRIAADRPFLDLAAPLADWQPPPMTRAACIFAGVARLVACAADPMTSAHINVTQTLALTERLIESGIPVVFLSTNQVFDGSVPNVPADAPASPVSEYGRQKSRAEAALRKYIDEGAAVAILRLAKVVSPDMPLIRGWMDALAAGKPIRAFHDMSMAPTPIRLVSAAITALLEDRAQGIFQFTGACDVAYVDVARFVANRLGADPALVSAVSARDHGLPKGATPAHTTLDSILLRECYDIAVPEPWDVIEQVIEKQTKKSTV